MLVKIVIVVMVVAMLVSLFSALYFMFRDDGGKKRMVKALTWRVGIWVVLLAFLGIGLYTGFIEPGNSLRPAARSAQHSD